MKILAWVLLVANTTVSGIASERECLRLYAAIMADLGWSAELIANPPDPALWPRCYSYEVAQR